jgi:hypothetical protein
MNGDLASTIRIEPAAPIIQIKQAAKDINGLHIEVLVMGYTDRIMINVTTDGKLGQLVSRLPFVSNRRSPYLSQIPFHRTTFWIKMATTAKWKTRHLI